MAKGKRSSKNNYTSKGERPNTTKSILKAKRLEYNDTMSQLINQVKAWRRGKKVMLTMQNPNKKETNKPYIRVNALDVWGPPRNINDIFSRRKKNDRVS